MSLGGEKMKKLSNDQLFCIIGGINFTGSLLNAIGRGMSILLDLGRSVGSAIRRSWGGRVCPL